MLKPFISVIIPTHNRRIQLRRAVQSVLSQSYPEFELIVVDDGSTDGTLEMIEGLNDPRIQTVALARSGVSKARNIGVKQSQGNLLAFLDSDDIWHRDKLIKQVQYHENNPQLDISQTQEIWIRSGKRVNPRHKHLKSAGNIFTESLQLCMITPSSVLLTRELFEQSGGFDTKMRACEDYDLWLRITPYHQVGLLDEYLLTKYGGHQDQLSQEYAAMDRFRIYSLAKILLHETLDDRQSKQARAVYENKLSVLRFGSLKRHPKNSPLISFLDQLITLNLPLQELLAKGEEFLLSDKYFF